MRTREGPGSARLQDKQAGAKIHYSAARRDRRETGLRVHVRSGRLPEARAAMRNAARRCDNNGGEVRRGTAQSHDRLGALIATAPAQRGAIRWGSADGIWL